MLGLCAGMDRGLGAIWRRVLDPTFFSLQADIVFSCWESTVPCLAVYMVSLYCKSEV